MKGSGGSGGGQIDTPEIITLKKSSLIRFNLKLEQLSCENVLKFVLLDKNFPDLFEVRFFY